MHIDRIPNSVAQGLNWTNVGLKLRGLYRVVAGASGFELD